MARANPHAGGLPLGRPDKSSETCSAANPVSVALETLQDPSFGGSKRTGPLLGDRRRKCQRPPSAETRNSAPSQLIVGGARPLRRHWPHPGCKVVCRRIDCRNSALLVAPDSAANGTVLPTISGESVRTDPFPLVQTPRDIQSAILGRRQMEGSTQPKLLGAPVSMCPANSALISLSDDTVRVLDGVTQEQMAT